MIQQNINKKEHNDQPEKCHEFRLIARMWCGVLPYTKICSGNMLLVILNWIIAQSVGVMKKKHRQAVMMRWWWWWWVYQRPFWNQSWTIRIMFYLYEGNNLKIIQMPRERKSKFVLNKTGFYSKKKEFHLDKQKM